MPKLYRDNQDVSPYYASLNNYSFFAILSDIHGKIDVLEAVFADIVKWPCKGVFRLSAAIGCGPESLLV